jgi:hypothetical protein
VAPAPDKRWARRRNSIMWAPMPKQFSFAEDTTVLAALTEDMNERSSLREHDYNDDQDDDPAADEAAGFAEYGQLPGSGPGSGFLNLAVGSNNDDDESKTTTKGTKRSSRAATTSMGTPLPDDVDFREDDEDPEPEPSVSASTSSSSRLPFSSGKGPVRVLPIPSSFIPTTAPPMTPAEFKERMKTHVQQMGGAGPRGGLSISRPPLHSNATAAKK